MLSLPVSTVIIGCTDVKQLEENVEIAKAFTPMPTAEMARLEAVTATSSPMRPLVPEGRGDPIEAR